MSPVAVAERVPDTAVERRARIALWATLVASWVVAVVYMWDAVTTVPSADLLEESRLLGIPTSRTFVTAAIFSGMELGVVLAALWPWRPSFYASRIGLAALGVVTWFIMTTPMDLSRMDWIHRRWLTFLAVTLTVGLLVLLMYRLWRRLAERRDVFAGSGSAD